MPWQSQLRFARRFKLHKRVPPNFAVKAGDNIKATARCVQHPEATFLVKVDDIGRADCSPVSEDFSLPLVAKN
jgi:hypothetical protein